MQGDVGHSVDTWKRRTRLTTLLEEIMRTALPLNTGILAILFVLLVPVQSFARGHHESGNVKVDIVSDQRGSLRQFHAGLQRVDAERSYVIARNGERYRIRISNPSNRRIGVVIAVDGRNIISGSKSHLGSHERMYILGPYQSQEYDGWRTGRNQINRFYFTGMNDSYAAHWGDQTAMGVVAIAVFNERYQQTYRKNDPAGGGRSRRFDKSHSQREAPGTGFGEGEWSPSREVRFAAQKRPAHKTFIKYEWRKTLCRMGVVQCRPKLAGHEHNHNRFWPHDRPHNRRNDGFAPFPSGLLPPRF